MVEGSLLLALQVSDGLPVGVACCPSGEQALDHAAIIPLPRIVSEQLRFRLLYREIERVLACNPQALAIRNSVEAEDLVVIARHLELVARTWLQRLLKDEYRPAHALLARVAGPPGVVVAVLEALQRSASVVPIRNHGLDRDPQGRLTRSQPAHLDLAEEEVVAVLRSGHLHQQ